MRNISLISMMQKKIVFINNEINQHVIFKSWILGKNNNNSNNIFVQTIPEQKTLL